MEFKVGTVAYKAREMDAFKQFHVARRLGGLLGLVGSIQQAAKGEKSAGELLGPLGDALATMEDEPLNYILYACLDVTEVKQNGGGWAPLRSNGVIMYPLNLASLLTVAAQVIKANMAGFMDALPPEVAGQLMKVSLS